MGWHYAALEERFRRIGDIEGALAILNWDTAVMMPKLAAPASGSLTSRAVSTKSCVPRRNTSPGVSPSLSASSGAMTPPGKPCGVGPKACASGTGGSSTTCMATRRCP